MIYAGSVKPTLLIWSINIVNTSCCGIDLHVCVPLYFKNFRASFQKQNLMTNLTRNSM